MCTFVVDGFEENACGNPRPSYQQACLHTLPLVIITYTTTERTAEQRVRQAWPGPNKAIESKKANAISSALQSLAVNWKHITRQLQSACSLCYRSRVNCSNSIVVKVDSGVPNPFVGGLKPHGQLRASDRLSTEADTGMQHRL